MKRQIEMMMLKLADGARILRFSEPELGICLEKRLDGVRPVLGQQKHWQEVFEKLLEREFANTQT
jgi:hypothetical protein